MRISFNPLLGTQKPIITVAFLAAFTASAVGLYSTTTRAAQVDTVKTVGVLGLAKRDGQLVVVDTRTVASKAGVVEGSVLTAVCAAPAPSWAAILPTAWRNREAGERFDADFVRDGKPLHLAIKPPALGQLTMANGGAKALVKAPDQLDAIDRATGLPVALRQGDQLARMCWPVVGVDDLLDVVGDLHDNAPVEYRFSLNGRAYSRVLPKLEHGRF